jgi:hypothetical protein
VPPKMAMPTKPSNRPRCSRDNDGKGMAGELASLPAGVQSWQAPHGRHALDRKPKLVQTSKFGIRQLRLFGAWLGRPARSGVGADRPVVQ